MNNDFVWIVEIGTTIMISAAGIILFEVIYCHRKIVELFQLLKKR